MRIRRSGAVPPDGSCSAPRVKAGTAAGFRMARRRSRVPGYRGGRRPVGRV